MAMFLIAGSFRITGDQPDGDSIRFTPDDPTQWDLITAVDDEPADGEGPPARPVEARAVCVERAARTPSDRMCGSTMWCVRRHDLGMS